MTLVWGLLVGLVFGIGAAVTRGWLSRVLNVTPIVLWFTWLIVLAAGGLTESETRRLGIGMLGVLLALFATWATFGSDRRRSRGHIR